ncbi:hypothetical protein ACQKP0_03910 [Heyndrickxia sp. NPDC080065]|uniref:hypothetical protein n=1 Tax=Heyndrickxia sp. NPDC080065 TaxID=3390568 RepID=UPI003D07E1B6
MNRLSPVMKMHMKSKFSWLLLPWAILLFSFGINLLIVVLVDDNKGFYTGGLASIFIYMFIIGIGIIAHTFPFALGLSVRRKDYFLGTITVFMVVSAVSAVVISVFSLLENLTSGWGHDLHFFSLLNAFNDNVFWQLWIFFILLSHMFLCGFIISSLYRRFGRNGMYLFFTILVLLFTVLSFACTYFQWWIPIFKWVSHNPNLLSLGIILVSVVYTLLSYLFLRRATV